VRGGIERIGDHAVDIGERTSYGRWSAERATTSGASAAEAALGPNLTSPTLVARQLALLVSKRPDGGTIQIRWNGTLLSTQSLKASSAATRQLITLPAFTANQTGVLEIRISTAGIVEIDGAGVWKTR
jgi:hypothetical protein